MASNAPKMERRHFEFLADVIEGMREASSYAEGLGLDGRWDVDGIALRFAEALGKTNENFKPQVWLKACGYNENVAWSKDLIDIYPQGQGEVYEDGEPTGETFEWTWVRDGEL